VEEFGVDILDDSLLVPTRDREQAVEDFKDDGSGVCLGRELQAKLQGVRFGSHPADSIDHLDEIFVPGAATLLQQGLDDLKVGVGLF
jgi:hypothetical protein